MMAVTIKLSKCTILYGKIMSLVVSIQLVARKSTANINTEEFVVFSFC